MTVFKTLIFPVVKSADILLTSRRFLKKDVLFTEESEHKKVNRRSSRNCGNARKIIGDGTLWRNLLRTCRYVPIVVLGNGASSVQEVVRSLWMDCDARLKKLAHIPAGVKRSGMCDLHEHFQAMLCIYDEGLLSDDKVLASALWRVLLNADPDKNAFLAEALTHYVRKHVKMLDDLSNDQFLSENVIKWQPFDNFMPTKVG